MEQMQHTVDAQARRPAASSRTTLDGTGKTSPLLAVVLICVLIPAQPEIAGQRIDAYRLFSLIFTIPFLVQIFSRPNNAPNASDYLMIGFAIWMIVTYFANHGAERLPYAVITSFELVGGYIAGRTLIRTVADYRALFRYLNLAMLVLIPLAVHEMVTSRILISELIQPFFGVYSNFGDERFGLARAQTVFPHPILFGLFCSIAVANAYYLNRRHTPTMISRLLVTLGATFTSLSSAPYLSAALQLAMIAWHKIIGPRWKLLLGIGIGIYVFLEIFSNRGPVILLIEYLTLNPRTAWWRVHIWNYGVQNVLDNPLFGLGLRDWVRPSWLAPTIDNFWLVIAMRHGIPGIVLLALGIGLSIYRILRAKIADPTLQDLRTGYMITLIGLLFTLATVHIWSSVAFFVMLYIGAGSFLFGPTLSGSGGNATPQTGGDTDHPQLKAQKQKFSRFAPAQRRRDRTGS